MWSSDVGSGAWISPRLQPFGTGAGSIVPAGFAAYARLLHPAGTDGGPGTPWSTVAAWSGVPLTADSSWLEVALPERRPATAMPWDGEGPGVGTYPTTMSAALVDVLASYTADSNDLWSGTWDGWGDLFVPAAVARLRHPQRGYALRHGSLAETARSATNTEWSTRPPNLWWPSDRRWCVASEIDADQTYVGGTTSLIDALVRCPQLEAQPIDRATASLELKAPAWLAVRLNAAAAAVLEHGGTTLELSRGTVFISLRRPGRGRAGILHTSSVDDHRGGAGGSTPLRRGDDVPALVPFALLWAVDGLTR